MTLSALDGEIRDLLRFAAERAILPRYRNLAEGEVEEKAKDDVVTIADKETELFLTEALTRLAPDVAVVGEEAVHADATVLERLNGPCWIIDPLDGTHNFASGKPPFGILVALADGGETVAGWIYDVLTGRFCHAAKGKGAFIDGQRVYARETGETLPVAAISLLFMDPDQRKKVQTHIAPHYRMVDIPRCAAEQYPRLVLGENDLSIFERTLSWDHAAGVLFLNEAGGKAARYDGSDYRVDHPTVRGLIGASSPKLWDEMAKQLNTMD